MTYAGVLALQGDFSRHLQAFADIGTSAIEVRTPEDLAKVERLVIPGGESTTVGKLLARTGLDLAIRERAGLGMPVWGTCMGMILMASQVEGSDQPTLAILDVTVRRNAFGAQIHSFEAEISCSGLESGVTGVFIRAPIVVAMGEGVEPLASYEGHIVAVRQGALLGTSFHPELTEDRRLHAWFAAQRAS